MLTLACGSDDWCVMSDHVVVHSKLGTVYVWNLGSGELERCYEVSVHCALLSRQFVHDRRNRLVLRSS